MNKLVHDLKGLKNLMVTIPVIYYILLLSSIIFADADRPRTIFYYNEMTFLPLIVMITIVYFQNELGGRMMEIYSTFPLSYSRMISRKLGVIATTTIILHLGWVFIYKLKFESFQSTIYFYDGQSPEFAETSWLQLILQAFPAYLLMMGVTTLFMILSKRLYGGLAAGFALWMLEVLSGGQLIPGVTLLTINVSEEVIFMTNRIVLIGLFMFCTVVSMMLINRRERWVIHQEIE